MAGSKLTVLLNATKGQLVALITPHSLGLF